MQDRPTFGVLSNQGLLSLVFGCNYNRKFFRNQILKEKIKIFGLWENTYHTIFIYGKILIIEFSYNFLYVWNCMKLYDKKFLIYGNCMIRSFGQPGLPTKILYYAPLSIQFVSLFNVCLYPLFLWGPTLYQIDLLPKKY